MLLMVGCCCCFYIKDVIVAVEMVGKVVLFVRMLLLSSSFSISKVTMSGPSALPNFASLMTADTSSIRMLPVARSLLLCLHHITYH